jgi:uncharacterized protein
MITDELILYLKNCQVTAKRTQAETRDENNVPMPGRNLFVSLTSHANNFFSRGVQPRMIALSGLRGVGKTTLMWQVAETVFKNHTKMVFFLSVDDLNRLGANLFEAFQVLEQHVFKKPLPELEEPVMFLIDEVHEAPEWDKDLKILYEKCKRAFVLCTGSSALLLHKSPDLATRWTLVKLFPFRFSEFILAKSWASNPDKQLFPAKGLGSELRNILLYSEDAIALSEGLKKLKNSIRLYFLEISKRFETENLTPLIDEYISYHNIARFLKIENKELINERVIGLFERIILKDIPEFTSSEDAARMQRLLMRLALSDEINFQKLSKEFRCSETEIENLTDTLGKAEILNVFHPYGGVNLKTGQSRKAFFMSPSLRRALYSRIFGPALEDNLRDKLYEDIVAMYLRKSVDMGLLSFGQSKGSKTPDFIVETREEPIVIEVGSYKVNTNQVSKYEKNKRYGIVISAREVNLITKEGAVIIPLSWFLLS